jgi:hypothetical protein
MAVSLMTRWAKVTAEGQTDAEYYAVRVEENANGTFRASVLGLPVFTLSATQAEAEEAIGVALADYLVRHPLDADVAQVLVAKVERSDLSLRVVLL